MGVDINPDYLSILKRRFASKIPGLELVEADFSLPGFRIEAVSLVFAALVFEYVNVRDTLKNMARCMTSDGNLVVMLQLPSLKSAPVTATRYKSLELLSPLMSLVSPDEFSNSAAGAGLQEIKAYTIPLKMGKAFWVGCYRKNTETVTGAEGKFAPRSSKF